MRALVWWPTSQGRHDDDARCRRANSTKSFLHYYARHQCPRQTRVHTAEISCLVTYVPHSLPCLDRVNYDETFAKYNALISKKIHQIKIKVKSIFAKSDTEKCIATLKIKFHFILWLESNFQEQQISTAYFTTKMYLRRIHFHQSIIALYSD